MYIIYTTDFTGIKTEYAQHSSATGIRELYHSILKRCLYGFPNIMEVTIEKDNKIISSFVNWRR